MEGFCLVATHLSSLNSSSPSTVVVSTSRQNPSLPFTTIHENDIPAEHATCSSILTTSSTGTILLRVIHGGVVVELSAPSAAVAPLRIIFPALVLSKPALFLWKETELHLLVMTDIASLFRLVIPIDGFKLWQDRTGSVWPREYFIRNMPREHIRECAFHPQGTHSVAVSLPNGDLLRIEAESFGYDGHEEEWVETVFHHGSFLSSLTSYLPIQTGISGASDIISLTSYPWPTDIGHIWTLSRDRTLRIWKAKLGCVASRTLPALPNGNMPPTSSSGGNKYTLLDAEQQNLLRVLSLPSNEERFDIYVIAFIPTSSSTTGGFFVVLDSSSDHLVEVGIIECPKHTAHCHLQDFMIHNKTLYALWDRQGQSMIEVTEINVAGLKSQPLPPVWKASHYAREPELTPAYMEEQLLNCGTLNEKFLNAIMKPGVFSSLTLRTSLDRYIDACLTLPGSPPPQLLNTYSTLCENIVGVVGCTVTLNRDPQTGGFQHANYWTALKRDWEGFVARCREVERSARWPLVIGAYGPNGIIVVERERIVSLVNEDAAISLRRTLELDLPPHPQHELLAILWGLRLKMGPRALSDLENRVMDIMHQEIAFSFSEILQDSARRLNIHELLDEGEQEWFAGRLSSIQDLDAATREALDCIGGFDLAVKKEDMEVELLTLPPPSEWLRSQAAAYSIVTIEARYDLCLCVITLLFFFADELETWDVYLLAEIFAVFKGVAMLRFVGAQPADCQSDAQGEAPSSADDMIAHMQNLNVSGYKSQTTSKLSLIQLLITQSSVADDIVTTAHNFLDGTGVLRSLSPTHATQHEIAFTNRIRVLNFVNVAWELLSWLPRTPATVFLQSLVLRQLGRVDDSAHLLETLAGCIGIPSMTLEDSSALATVLPNSQIMDSEYNYYLFAAELFRHEYVYHEVKFSKLALQGSPAGVDIGPLWKTIVNGLADLGLYEEAYATLMQISSEPLRRDLACQLAIQMSEENAVEKLVQFDFTGITSEIEAALAFKARNADPRSRPSYSKILYAWYVGRGDYRNAALTMYQRSRKLRDIIVDPTSFISLAEDQLEALSIAINALYLVDEKSGWILVPVMPDSNRQPQKLSKHIPESKYVSSKYDAEIIHLSDLEYNCTLLRAQIDSIKREPSLLSSPEYLLPSSVIVMRLAQESQYNKALHLAQSLKIDMTDIFAHLTNQCIRLTRNPGSALQEDTSGWLLTDNAASWHGSPSDRGWRYLQQSLVRYDGPNNDCRYAKSALETILSANKPLSPPLWLIGLLEKYNPEYLIRVNLRYGNIADAVNYTYALVLKSDRQMAQESSKTASTTWLPYALIDQVLSAADDLLNPPTNLSELRSAVNNRVKRMQKISRNIIDM